MPTQTIEKELVECYDCGDKKNEESITVIKARSYCPECVAECEDCHTTTPSHDMVSVQGDKNVCSNCEGNYNNCSECGDQYHMDDDEWRRGTDGMCVNCSGPEYPRRNWERADYLTKWKEGKYMRSKRIFGIENELNYKAIQDVVDVSDNIDENIGIGEDAGGAEFQTPPSCGVEAEKMIRQLMYRARKHKLYMQNGCGFHLHVDAADLDWKGIKNLWLLYIVFDDVIRSFTDTYRRASNYCLPTKDIFKKVMVCETQEELEYLYYGLFMSYVTKERVKDCKKYRKSVKRMGFNLQCVFAEKHLEIRYHEATLSGRRILEWANLHCLMMDLAKEGFAEEWIKRMHKRKIGKMQWLFSAIGLSASSSYYWKKVKDALPKLETGNAMQIS